MAYGHNLNDPRFVIDGVEHSIGAHPKAVFLTIGSFLQLSGLGLVSSERMACVILEKIGGSRRSISRSAGALIRTSYLGEGVSCLFPQDTP